jgi:cell pole-organizing protein PopZ
MNAANPKAQEPSMEEILASIRRIIADDQDSLRSDTGVASQAASSHARKAAEPYDDPANDHAIEGLLGSADDGDDYLPRAPHYEYDADDDREHDDAADLARPQHEAEPVKPVSPPPVSERAYQIDHPSERASAGRAADGLLSDATTASISSAFDRLEPIDDAPPAPRMVEEWVTDLLRPMLKSWMDENLPAIVERLVQAEIQRVTRSRR